jgi:hypothetical protein
MATLSSIRSAAIEDTGFSSGLDSAQVTAIAGGVGLSVYSTLDNLPTSGLTSGDQAFVSSTNRFYISNGTGWYNVALINATPTLSISPSGAVTLATDGSTPTVITLIGTDSDNADANLAYSVESDGSFGGLATLSQDSSVFTITPLSEDSATSAASILTFKVSDGISFGSGTTTFTLTFNVANANYTTLLAKADVAGTDNQVDASTNTHTITEVGNVTSTALSPYHPGGYSVLYDGNSDSLSVSSDASLDFGTGDFTMEAWVYPTETGNNYPSFMSSVTGWSSGASGHRFDNTGYSGKFAFYANGFGGRSGGNPFMHSTNTFTHNKWYHYAITRSGTTFKMYINGVLEDTQTDSGSLNAALGGFRSGGSFDGANGYFAGYVRDIRIVKGSVVYTEAFIPPTAPLTAIANTSLLICHAPYIADGSSNSHAITIAGTAQTRRFGPYDYDSYTRANHGGSVYFDGSGDYITGATPATMGIGTGDFTIECWFYATAGDTNKGVWDTHSASSSADGLTLTRTSATTFRIWQASQILVSSAVGITNAWNHLATVRNSGTLELFVNGVSQGTVANSTNMNSSLGIAIGGGRYSSGTPTFNVTGHISDFRVTTTAVYTSDFTPPTAALTAITNTQLLTCTNKNDIWDASSGSFLTKVDNATSSNTQRKFTTSSAIYFDGSGDRITVPYSQLTSLGSGDFTVEWWMRPTANATMRPLGFDSNGAGTWIVVMYSNGTFDIAYEVTAVFSSASSYSSGTWQHIAWTRSGSISRLFIDGILDKTNSSFTYNFDQNTSHALQIGYNTAPNPSQAFNGYLQDLRITRGLARYTANFTPPTEEFTG